MQRRIIRVVCWVIGMVGFGLMRGNLLDQNYLAFIGGVVIAGVVYISYAPEKKVVEAKPLNREARRHPNGKAPAQKFKTVNARGRQKQGNNKAVKGW
ncbi:hypothetical protein SEA_BILLNYE_171 [Streptomyces phage BillNye]|uniref:Uncharacterized protein n=2 Tax=Wilnyevirus billnye TaxID=2560486 RepID=A0A2L1IW48_9CAUD|nr:hypothetical protein FDJ30_gp090 [Streptomyces phage BillNye]AVD99343.1 hypothetical protein SEA_BILLNYE_171 [Streptomyces phage BillNye]QBZ72426.1 hypothetical protein SEA_CIRCINUS_172 [Streptomyces phage Circinus]